MTPNWRRRLAAELLYIDVGRALCETPYRLLVAAGMVKLLAPGMPLWQVGVLAPLMLAGLALLGRFHKTHGWLRHTGNAAIIEGLSPASAVQFEWMARLLRDRGLPLNGVGAQPSRVILDVLEAAARGHAPADAP